MIGIPSSEPNDPWLVMVKVPPSTSPGMSRRLRARSARSAMARLSSMTLRPCARLMTGTISPSSSATAMPRPTSSRYAMLSPSSDALTTGTSASASSTARAMKARWVSFAPACS